jgi:hypothetical protein
MDGGETDFATAVDAVLLEGAVAATFFEALTHPIERMATKIRTKDFFIEIIFIIENRIMIESLMLQINYLGTG